MLTLKGKIGDFFSLHYDEQATRDAGVLDWNSYEYGVFSGQLIKYHDGGNVAEFSLAASTDQGSEAWKTRVNLVTGRIPTSGVVISQIDRMDFRGQVSERQIKRAAEDAVRDLVDRKVSGPAPIITINLDKNGTQQVKVKERTHKLFAKLAYYVSKGANVYLWSNLPGTGKSHAAEQLARVTKRSYGYLALNSQTPDSRLFGFINPVTGKYVPTEFFNSYSKGKSVFCLDEADNGTAGILTTLNGMYANPKAGFPCGTTPRGAAHTLVATGNTCGRGADDLFPDRWAFDQAFADRFTFIEWEHDEQMEREIALQINPVCDTWVDWCLRARVYCQQNYPRLFVTPRVTYRVADYLLDGPVPLVELVEDCLFKGFDRDSKRAILAANPLPQVEVISRKEAKQNANVA